MTWICDIIWMLYYWPLWNSDEMKDWMKGVHTFVLFFSLLNFVLKVGVMAMIGLAEKETLSMKQPGMSNEA